MKYYLGKILSKILGLMSAIQERLPARPAWMPRPQRGQMKFASILAGALIVSIFAGTVFTTFAMDWGTVDTEARANVFTQGDVAVEIDEPNWPGLPAQELARVIYPNRIFPKDPIAIHQGAVPQFLFLEVWSPVYTMAVVVPRGTTVNLPGHGNVTAPANRDVIVPNTPDGQHVVMEMFRYTVNTTHWTHLAARNRTAYLNAAGVEVPAGTAGAQRFHVRVYGYLHIAAPGHETPPLFTTVQAANFLEGVSRVPEHAIDMGTQVRMPVFALAVQAEHLTGDNASDTMAQRLDNAFGRFLERDA